jgi:hypothetical protein
LCSVAMRCAGTRVQAAFFKVSAADVVLLVWIRYVGAPPP